MGMDFEKTSAGGAFFNSIVKLALGPYDSGIAGESDEIPVTSIGPVATTLVNIFGNTRAYALIRNTSPAGQQIRFSSVGTPSFIAPVIGMLLLPGETWEMYDLKIAVLGYADAAGALCSRYIVRSSAI